VQDNFNKRYHVQVHIVKLDDTETVTTTFAAVTFPVSFDNVPEVIVIRPLLADGTWSVESTVTTSACTLTVTGENNMSTGTAYKIQIASFERS